MFQKLKKEKKNNCDFITVNVIKYLIDETC